MIGSTFSDLIHLSRHTSMHKRKLNDIYMTDDDAQPSKVQKFQHEPESANITWWEIDDVLVSIICYFSSDKKAIINLYRTSKRFHRFLRSKTAWQRLGKSLYYSSDPISNDTLRDILLERQSLADLPFIFADLFSDDRTKYVGPLRHYVTLFKTETRAAYVSQIIPRMIEFLDITDVPHLRGLSCTLLRLAYVARGETHFQILEKLRQLITSPSLASDEIIQVLDLLNTLANKEKSMRWDIVTRFMAHVIDMSKNANGPLLISLLNWIRFRCYSVEVKKLAWNYVSPALPILARIISDPNSEDNVLVAAIMVLVALSNKRHPTDLQAIIDSGACRKLATFLTPSKIPSKAVAALEVLGNIADGSDRQKEFVMNLPDLLGHIRLLLVTHDQPVMIKSKCALLISRLATTPSHIETFFEADFFALIVELIEQLKNEKEVISQYATWSLCNITIYGDKERIKTIIIDSEIAVTIAKQVKFKGVPILRVILKSLDRLLEIGAEISGPYRQNSVVLQLKNADLIPPIEELQRYESDLVYEDTVALIERHFSNPY